MRTYFIIIVFTLFFGTSQAQRFKGAVVGGFNLSQVDGDRLYRYNKIGFNLGGQVAAVLTDRWQLSFEMAYSQRGSARTNNDDPGSVYDRIQLNYVETPVMIRFLDWKFHFTAGLSYNRLINFRVEDAFGEDITDLQNYRRNNAAVVLGATYFSNEHLGFDLRWSHSLFDLQGEQNLGLRWDEKWITFRTVYVF